MLSLRQPVTGTATGRRDKVQPVGDRPVPFSCGEGGVDTVHARRGKVSGQISGLFPDARLTLKVSQPVTPAPPPSVMGAATWNHTNSHVTVLYGESGQHPSGMPAAPVVRARWEQSR